MSGGRAIVLGGGLDGLAAALRLASAGRSVQVVDGSTIPGGLAARVPFGDGYSAPGLAVDPALTRLGSLASVGASAPTQPAERVHVLTDGRATPLPPLARGTRAWVSRLEGLLRDWVEAPPPELAEPGARDLLDLVKFGWRLRGLGKADLPELFRVATLPAWDWLDDETRAAECAGHVGPALTGTVVGPRAAGTSALVLLRGLLGNGEEPAGGLAALHDALLERARAAGVALALERSPTRLDVQGGAVRRVHLNDGTVVETDLVLSTLGPQPTLLELVEARHLEHALEREVTGWRTRGSTAVVLFGCARVPTIASGAGLPARLVTARDLTQLERAADALKYGELPEDPWLDLRLWSGTPHAPAGGAVLVAHVHGVGRELARPAEDARATVEARVRTVLDGLLADAASDLGPCEVLLPEDLEARLGLPGGHIFGGDLALDQLWIGRPSLALSRYGTPLAGLFLGGPSSHPGGPFQGAAGLLAAEAALRVG